MKCLLCANEIDDKKEFPRVYSEEKRDWFYDEAGQRAHAAQQNRWQQIQVTVGPTLDIVLVLGHICQEEHLGNIALCRTDGTGEVCGYMPPQRGDLVLAAERARVAVTEDLLAVARAATQRAAESRARRASGLNELPTNNP